MLGQTAASLLTWCAFAATQRHLRAPRQQASKLPESHTANKPRLHSEAALLAAARGHSLLQQSFVSLCPRETGKICDVGACRLLLPTISALRHAPTPPGASLPLQSTHAAYVTRRREERQSSTTPQALAKPIFPSAAWIFVTAPQRI